METNQLFDLDSKCFLTTIMTFRVSKKRQNYYLGIQTVNYFQKNPNTSKKQKQKTLTS